MGVARAIDLLDTALDGYEGPGKIWTFGPLIHNPKVQATFAARGVGCTENSAEISAGDTVVIRAHGLPLPLENRLMEAGARVLDATCPHVKRAQRGIADQSGLGRKLLLLGEEQHPEVQGLLSHALPGSLIFTSLKELQELNPDSKTDWFLAAQTTQELEEFDRVAAWVRQNFGPETPVLSTICGATRQRQEEVRAMAPQSDAVVVVGGLESGNTRRLAHVAEEMGVPAYHVEEAEQLPVEELRRCRTVLLTAGASTPRVQIEAMQQFLEAL